MATETFAESLRALAAARGYETLAQISKQTHVSRIQIERYLTGENLPEWGTVFAIIRGLGLTTTETVEFVTTRLRDRLMDEVSQAGIYLFLAVGDDTTRALTVTALQEMLGITLDARLIEPGLVAIAEGRDAEMLGYREAMAPWFIRSAVFATNPPSLLLSAGSVLATTLERRESGAHGGTSEASSPSPARVENGECIER